jgi:adenylate cyclase
MAGQPGRAVGPLPGRKGRALSNIEAERRLAAILIADVVGYSRLMEADEKRTLTALKALRAAAIDPVIALHHGRIVKLMGDAILAEFSSVVAAVTAAVEITKGVAAEQTDVVPGRRLLFRIGVNLGDVMVDGDDIYGHGVNVAARLCQICPPGGVFVSGSAYDQLHTLDITLRPAGEQRVKNISSPIRVYRVKLDGSASKPASARIRLPALRSLRWLPWMGAALIVLLALAGAAAWWLRPTPPPHSGPSLMVLPFDNLGDDKEQGYLADGISEDLTTELARIPGLFVLSRTAAAAYRDTETDLQQIASRMGVRYVLDGSVRRAGDDIRINAQLLDGETGGHLWAERYEGTWNDVLALQDTVVTGVARALELRLVRPERPGGTTNVAAYDSYLKGLGLELRGSPGDFAEAVRHFKRAIELDPAYGQALAELAWVYYASAGNEERQQALGTGTLQTIALAQAGFEEAMKHPSARAYQLAGERHINHWESDLAIAELARAIELDPSDVWNYRQMAKANILGGHPDKGLTNIATSLRLDPREHQWTIALRGLAEFALERYPRGCHIPGEIAARSRRQQLRQPAAFDDDLRQARR